MGLEEEGIRTTSPGSRPGNRLTCISSVSILRSYAVKLILAKTSARVKCLPSLCSTTSSGNFFILLLMKRSKCFWFMQAEW